MAAHSQDLPVVEDEVNYHVLVDQADLEHDPRMRTRVFTYLRQNYLKVIKYLITLILFLLLLSVILVILILSLPRHHEITEDSDDAMSSLPLFPSVAGQHSWGRKIPCARIRCNNESCLPQDIEYTSLRNYVCCPCYSSRYTFRRFQWDYLRKELSIYFQVPEVISDLSEYDLASLPKLEGLDGSWNMVQEGGSAWYLKYEDVSIPQPPRQD